MPIEITAMTIEHYPEVWALWKATPGIGLSQADSRENIQSYLERNSGLSLVALEDGLVAGAVLAGHDGRRGYLHHLAVAPEYRRRGLGRALVEGCLAGLAALGLGKVHVFVMAGNVTGIHFWRNSGWIYRSDLAVISRDL